MERTWQLGIDRLAEGVCYELDHDDLAGYLPMMAELFDKLICGTSECPDPQKIIDYLITTHGWSQPHAKLVAAMSNVVDGVRTSGFPADVFWASDLVEGLEGAR